MTLLKKLLVKVWTHTTPLPKRHTTEQMICISCCIRTSVRNGEESGLSVRLLFTIYYLLFTIYYLLFTIYYYWCVVGAQLGLDDANPPAGDPLLKLNPDG